MMRHDALEADKKTKRFLHIYPSSEGEQGEWNECYAKDSCIGCGKFGWGCWCGECRERTNR
jgi:hypothetical protein